MADSVRAERAVGITARFADPYPFRPIIQTPGLRILPVAFLAGDGDGCSGIGEDHDVVMGALTC
jgi:hypothetical protein